MSEPPAPTRVSFPSPPESVSFPAPPVRTLALASPLRLFATRADPVTFSMLVRTSPCASPPDWAPVRCRSTVTPAAEAE
ncbi:hypothetical protein SLNSH_23950 [Alsobacter soli]|uniref:Uncharacterized protein n=1 Tax=Alsobacter soli TaxID=2109933 RepID=A0A2T1HLF1_9HYPH|nr:hypothetical protein SLNSH_23950 [Alsobacter soli]